MLLAECAEMPNSVEIPENDSTRCDGAKWFRCFDGPPLGLPIRKPPHNLPTGLLSQGREVIMRRSKVFLVLIIAALAAVTMSLFRDS
jgi:hypothetical protein